ncbi:MAG TPA: hypothetical protein VGH07_03965, partial [Chthoniobacterales bacterium]
AYNRPSSDLDITYVVFPGSAEEPPGPPDLRKLRDRCSALLNEIGGYNGELFLWEDILAKPSPSPSVSVSVSASPSPSGTAARSPTAQSTTTAKPSVTP